MEWLSSRGKNTQHENLRSANSPENLLRENSKNFKLNQAEIREASIEPIKYVARSGKAGRLVFTIRHGEKIKLEFDSTDEMNRAICLLTETLQPALTINGTSETKTAKVKTV